MTLPKVSIIIVTYNAQAALSATLDNINKLRYSNLEVIVVDGASTDGTAEFLVEHGAPVTRWLSEPDHGIYDAMNKGMELASGAYLWFINAGDKIYNPLILNRIFEPEVKPPHPVIDSDTRDSFADIYYGETLVVAPTGAVLGLRKKPLPEQLTWCSFRRGMTLCHQSILVRRSIAPRYATKYRYAADVEWVLVALQRAQSIVNVHQILSIFEAGGLSSVNRQRSLRERFLIMVHYFGWVQTLWAHVCFVGDYFKPAYRKFDPNFWGK